ncbi:hypothetical protein BST61_g3792 [Cercospora zeina]
MDDNRISVPTTRRSPCEASNQGRGNCLNATLTQADLQPAGLPLNDQDEPWQCPSIRRSGRLEQMVAPRRDCYDSPLKSKWDARQ